MALSFDTLPQLRPGMQWTLLAAGSTLLTALLFVAGLPAPLLIGPMVAAIAGGACGLTIRVGRAPFAAVQALLGCMIAGTVTPDIVATVLADWPLFLGLVLATLLASALLGWLLCRGRVLPDTTGLWGTSPGAAVAMVVMADAFGADVRLVAFMQYLRLVCVAVGAAVIAGLWTHGAAGSVAEAGWFPPLDLPAFGETLALAGLGGLAGMLLRIPSGAMLVPLLAGSVLHATGLLVLELPQWLLAGAYAVLGWRIGLCFTRPVLLHASRALPLVLASIAALMLFCGGLAWLLVVLLGTDPLTAYLATSPGGMDTVAVIAMSSHVDVPFVMAQQTLRFFLVTLSGPPLARFLARRLQGPPRGGAR